MPFNSETLVTGKLFEDIRDAVHATARPEDYDAARAELLTAAAGRISSLSALVAATGAPVMALVFGLRGLAVGQSCVILNHFPADSGSESDPILDQPAVPPRAASPASASANGSTTSPAPRTRSAAIVLLPRTPA